MTFFTNRIEAGRLLASKLLDYAEKSIVIAIPRGGVVVGYEMAQKLRIPLDIIVPRKIRAPNNPELAIGAVTEDGTMFLDHKLIKYIGVSESHIKEESERQRLEIKRRLKLYRGNSPFPNLKDLHVIVVDDGIATGATMRATLVSIRKREVKSVILAIPVASSEALKMLESEADVTICLFTPTPFFALSRFYRYFEQTSDEEVVELLKKNKIELG
jgi:predicted phosphoribosyltransferase